MQIKETTGASFHSPEECPRLEDVLTLPGNAGVVPRARHAFSTRVWGGRDSGLVAPNRVDIPLVGRNGEVSGVLCRAASRCDTRETVATGGRNGARAMEDVARFVIHDINNLLTVISTSLQLLERESDASRRTVIVRRMQHAITRGALLSRQLLDVARPRPKSIGGFVAGRRLATLADTLDQALRSDVTVRADIAADLWDFDADPEELYFALLNLCRNAADAIPKGGAITVAARNVELPAAGRRGFVEIAVADDGEGMTEEVLSQAFTPYFTTKVAGAGTGLGLAQVRHFVEGRGGAVDIESKPGAGTLVRLFLPRVGDAAVPRNFVETKIA